MNTVGVVALFAVAFIQDASTLTCKKTANYAPSDLNLIVFEEETCTTETKCRRPIFEDPAYATGETWGCGMTCAVANSGKCITCGDDNCNKPPVKCKIGADAPAASTADSTFCADKKKGDIMTPQECLRPKKTYDTWAAGETFKCGLSCADDAAAAANCVDCDTDGCNDPASVANKLSADHKCFVYTYTNNAFTKAAATQCIGNDDAVAKCNMPKAAATDGSGIYNGGCGPCDPSKSAVCADCDEASCNDIRECYTDEANTASKLCFGEDNCKRPLKSYGGYASSGTWDCGACTQGSKDCKDCDTDKCNAKVESKTSKCYTYKWETDKFVKGDSAACDRGENAAIACNMPKDAVKQTDYTTTTGCGPCKDNEKCEVCAEEECNSAPVKTATALLLALLYIMI